MPGALAWTRARAGPTTAGAGIALRTARSRPRTRRDHRERPSGPLWPQPQPVFPARRQPIGQRQRGRGQGCVAPGGLGLDRTSPRCRYTPSPPGRAGFSGLARAALCFARANPQPLGGRWGRQGAASDRARCGAHGGQEVMPGSSVGGGGTLRSALTGPPSAALTGVPWRPNEREPPRPATHGPPAGWQPCWRRGQPGGSQHGRPPAREAPGLSPR